VVVVHDVTKPLLSATVNLQGDRIVVGVWIDAAVFDTAVGSDRIAGVKRLAPLADFAFAGKQQVCVGRVGLNVDLRLEGGVPVDRVGLLHHVVRVPVVVILHDDARAGLGRP